MKPSHVCTVPTVQLLRLFLKPEHQRLSPGARKKCSQKGQEDGVWKRYKAKAGRQEHWRKERNSGKIYKEQEDRVRQEIFLTLTVSSIVSVKENGKEIQRE